MNWCIAIWLQLLLMCVVHSPAKKLSYIQVLIDEGPVIPTKFLRVLEGTWRHYHQIPDGKDARGEDPKNRKQLGNIILRIKELHENFINCPKTQMVSSEFVKYALIKDRPSSLAAAAFLAVYSCNQAVDENTTHIEAEYLDADAPCPRRDAVLELARQKSSEYQEWKKDASYKTLFDKLTKYAKEPATDENFMDLMKIVATEEIDFSDPASKELLTLGEPWLKKIGAFNMGNFPQPVTFNGINLDAEIRKSRASRVMSTFVNMAANTKGARMLTIATVSTTIQAILMDFGLQDRIESYLPTAGRAIMIEFYDASPDRFFKLRYSNNGTEFEDLTNAIGCEDGYCKIEKFEAMGSAYSNNLFDCKADPTMFTIAATMATPGVTNPPPTTMVTKKLETTEAPVVVECNENAIRADALATCSSTVPLALMAAFLAWAIIASISAGFFFYKWNGSKKDDDDKKTSRSKKTKKGDDASSNVESSTQKV